MDAAQISGHNTQMAISLKKQYGQAAQNMPEFQRIYRYLKAAQQQMNASRTAAQMPNNAASNVAAPQMPMPTSAPSPAAHEASNYSPASQPAQPQLSLLTPEIQQLSKLQIQTFRSLCNNYPFPAQLYQAVVNHYESIVNNQPNGITHNVSPHQPLTPNVQQPVASPEVGLLNVQMKASPVVAAPNLVGVPGVSASSTAMHVAEPHSKNLVVANPEPPVSESDIIARYPNSKKYTVHDPNLLADAYKLPANNEKIPFELLQRARIIMPGFFPRGFDVEGAHQVRESVIVLKIEETIKSLEQQISVETEDDIKEQLEIDLHALKCLQVQKNVRGKYLSFVWYQNSVLANTHPNFFAKIKPIDINEAIQTNNLYASQKSTTKLIKKAEKSTKVSSQLVKTQSVCVQRNQVFDRLKKLTKQVSNFHANTEKEEQKRAERNAKQRLQALKANDEDAYIKLLDQTKDTRITHLLKQTNTFLQSLAQSVKAQQKETREHSHMAGRAFESEEDFKKQYGDDADSTDLDYYNVAHRIKEVVTKQPSILVGGTLKEYQLKGLQWMVSLVNNHLNGILADEMGLGKTIQTISLITYMVEVKKVPGPFLIIVPLSTLTNWDLEFDKWAPSVKKITFKGSPNQRRSMYEDIRVGNFQILLTTFDYIIKERPLLAKIRWAHMIIDEGHRMKNTKSKLSLTLTTYYHTDYRLILTGTPLQNNLPELWALLNFVLPKIFNSVKSFDEWFNTPFANTGSQDKMDLSEEETLLVIRRLHKVLRPFLLRRLKKDVEKDLPNKVEKVIKCKMSALQHKLYWHMAKHRSLYTYDHESKKIVNIKGINNPIMQLRKIVNHPFVYEEVEAAINPTQETDDMIWRVSGKFEVLDRILPKFKASGHRVLLFFQMTQIMTIMEDFLHLRGMKYLRLDGGTKSDERTQLLKLFNEPNSEYFAFLLSTRAGGLGLNLQTADTVIIFDTDWNPHQDLQAQDRAHRIGQKNEVRILRLITENSVEEVVLQKAHEKLVIDGKVIQAGKFDNKSTAEEQEALLRQLLEAGESKSKDDDEDDELTPDELNAILARNDDEKVLFRQIDEEMNRDWAARNQELGVNHTRLYEASELPDFYKKDPPVKKAVVVDGVRAKKKISYTDESLSEFEWSRAHGLVEDEGLGMDDLRPGKRKRGRKKATTITELPEDFDEEDFGDINGIGDDDDDDDVDDEEFKVRGRKKKTRKVSGDESSSVTQSPSMKPKKGKRGRGRAPKDPPEEFVDLSDEQRSKLQGDMKTIYDKVMNFEVETGYEEQPYRKLSEIFKEKPSKKLYPDYYGIIQKPISLKEIKKKMTGHSYFKIEQFMRDMKLMFANAKKYNQEGSIVYNDAINLEKVADGTYDSLSPAPAPSVTIAASAPSMGATVNDSMMPPQMPPADFVDGFAESKEALTMNELEDQIEGSVGGLFDKVEDFDPGFQL